jgi:hypothetical protein
MFIELETESMMIPWIYFCYNEDVLNLPSGDSKAVRSANTSKSMPGGGTSININKSALAQGASH